MNFKFSMFFPILCIFVIFISFFNMSIFFKYVQYIIKYYFCIQYKNIFIMLFIFYNILNVEICFLYNKY